MEDYHKFVNSCELQPITYISLVLAMQTRVWWDEEFILCGNNWLDTIEKFKIIIQASLDYSIREICMGGIASLRAKKRQMRLFKVCGPRHPYLRCMDTTYKLHYNNGCWAGGSLIAWRLPGFP